MMVLRHKSGKDHPESPRVCQELCADKVSEALGPHSGSPGGYDGMGWTREEVSAEGCSSRRPEMSMCTPRSHTVTALPCSPACPLSAPILLLGDCSVGLVYIQVPPWARVVPSIVTAWRQRQLSSWGRWDRRESVATQERGGCIGDRMTQERR